MEGTGILIVIAVIVLAIIVIAIGRAAKRKKTAMEASQGNKRPVPAQFSDRGH